jgi:NADH-ubiquinone oxidoreductase chain 3
MTSITFFFIFIPLLAVILLAINLIFAPHNPYQEKDSAFECGFHSFLGQNRTQFSISFFIFALLFLLFDLEIILIFPYAVSAFTNDIYGLLIMFIFFLILTVGFAFELGKNALKIDSRQTFTFTNKESSLTTYLSYGLPKVWCRYYASRASTASINSLTASENIKETEEYIEDFQGYKRTLEKSLEDLKNKENISDLKETEEAVNQARVCARSNQDIVKGDLSKENLEAAHKELVETIIPR